MSDSAASELIGTHAPRLAAKLSHQADWVQSRLTDIAHYHNGVAFKPADWSMDGLRIIRIEQLNNPNGQFDKYAGPVSEVNRIRDGDLVFSWSATLKVVIWQHGDAVLNQHLFKVVPKPEVDTRFVFFLLDHNMEALGGGSHGSTMKHIRRSELDKFIVRMPKLATQQKIAAILTRIDTAIEKTEALIGKYKHIKAGLMHDLFTRGVLPNGTLRPPHTEAPELYQQTPIGWIPKEWKVARAGDLCSLITKGTTPSSSDMWEGQDGVRFLRVDNLSFDGQFNFNASSYRISTQIHTVLLARSMCVPGDVLMNIVGPPLGKVALVTQNDGDININQAIAIFRPKAELSSLFLLRWLISDSAKRWILQRAKQTSGQLNVTLAMCQDLALPHMSIAEQQRIEARIQGAEFLVQSESNRRTKLQRQKLGLMQDLLTGTVQVKVKSTSGETVNV